MRITKTKDNVTTDGEVIDVMTCSLEYLALQFENLNYDQRKDAMDKTIAVMAMDTPDESVILDDIEEVTIDFDINPDEEEWTYSINGAELTNIEVISLLGQALHYAFAMQGTPEHILLRSYDNFFNVLNTEIVENHYIRREAMKKAKEEEELYKKQEQERLEREEAEKKEREAEEEKRRQKEEAAEEKRKEEERERIREEVRAELLREQEAEAEAEAEAETPEPVEDETEEKEDNA